MDRVSRLLMRRNQRATVALVAELEARGLSPLVLKGPATQVLLYPAEARTSTDIDLLVAPREQRAARRALADLGYEQYFVTSYATSWAAPGLEPVDLHSTLPRCHAGRAEVARLLAGHRTTIPVEGRSLPVLDPAGMAVHLTLHLTQAVSDRTVEDLRRAVAVLTVDQWQDASGLAARLGTASSMAWALDQVPGGPELRDQLGLNVVERFALPARKVSEGGVARLLRSPVNGRERAFDLGQAIRRKARITSLTSWAAVQGRTAPVGTRQHLETLAARAWTLVRPAPRGGAAPGEHEPR